MEEVAALMRQSLPEAMSIAEFGRRMAWGRGNGDARARMNSLTVEELQDIGLTHEQAVQWAVAYEAVGELMPKNPSAAGRAELMHHAAGLLAGD